MQKILKLFKKYWPLILLLFFTFLLRIIKLEQLFYFTYDESIPAFVGRRMFFWHHVPLIGGVTPFGVHLTPYFYWFLSAILILGNLNPIAWGWVGAAVAIATTFMMYIVGSSFTNKKVGYTASLFWTFSYLANIYDRHLWALYLGPLLSLVVLYSLYKIKKNSNNFVFLLAIAITIAISADPSNIVFVLLSIVVWIIYKLPLNRKTFLAILIVALSLLPLLIFDFRHNFANTRPFIEFWKAGKNNPGFRTAKFSENTLIFPRAFTRLIYTFGDNQIAKQYAYCSNFVKEKYQAIPDTAVLVSSLILLGFVLFSIRSKEKSGWQLISLLLLIYFVGIQAYGTFLKADIFEHYISGLFAVFLLIFAKIISLLPKKIWLAFITLFIFLNFHKLLIAKNSHGLKFKKEAIEFTMNNVGKKDFSLDSLSTCWRLSGYRYLFAVFGKEPVKSYVDPNLGYFYGTTPIAQNHPPTVVAFVTRDFVVETDKFFKKYALYKSHEVKNGLFGNIEVIILDNTSGWFE